MKTKALPAFVIIVSLPLSLMQCSRENEGRPAGVVSQGQLSPSGVIVLTLDAERQKAAGLQVVALQAAVLEPEEKCYGRVLDASPLAMLVDDLSAAQANHRASEAELKRSKTLTAQDNASIRSLEAAEAAEARDRVQVDSVRHRLLAGWGSAIAGRRDLQAFVQALMSLDTVLVRLDLPAGESLDPAPTRARLAPLSREDKSTDGQLLGPAPTVDSQTQGRAFLLVVKANRRDFTPGTAVIGYLRRAGQPLSGVVIPESSLVRHQGNAWVYVQTNGTAFSRRPVVLDHPAGDGWLITDGLKPGERVVASGAQTLLSEELKSRIRIGD